MSVENKIEKLKNAIDELAAVVYTTVIKNGVEFYGVCLDNHKNIRPTIYMNNYLDMIESNDDIKGIAEKMIQDLQNINPLEDYNIKEFLNKEYIYNNVIVKLEKHVKTAEQVRDSYHSNLFDAVYALDVTDTLPSNKIGNASVKLTMQMILEAQMGPEDIDKLKIAAHKNIKKKYGIKFKSMFDVLGKLISGIPEEEKTNGMYILTNDKGVNGTALILDNEVMDDICDKLQTEKLIILPSSIHEVIILKESEFTKLQDLLQLVKEVNASQVKPEDQLGDFVMIYNKEIGREIIR